MTTREEIARQFEKDMWDAYLKPFHSLYHYNATGYRQMLDDFKPEGTAILLIDGEETNSGFITLGDIHMLEWSVEAIILKPKYRIPDFAPTTPERRTKARQRLWNYFNYKAPWDDGK